MKILKVLAWIVGTPLVLFGLLLLARFVGCGPDSADVKVMKPMAEKISEYIVKNGIPKSLKNIPDLPYELEGCKGKQTYYKFDNKAFTNIEVSLKKDAEFKVIDETCYFANKAKHYYIELNEDYTFRDSGSLIIKIKNDNSGTGIQYFFKIDQKDNVYIERKGNPYGSKTSGICFQLRQ